MGSFALALRPLEFFFTQYRRVWRGTFFGTLVSPVLFGLTVRGLGLLPAIAIVASISSFASRRMGIVLAAGITVVLTVFCVLVFNVGLGLPIRLIGPWLS